FAKLLNKKYGTHTESRILHLHKIFYSARNEGIWFSDFWMKVLGIFLFVYTVTLVLVAYCVT
ncbi:hypothetical protein KSX06_08725, partial [Bacteroides uniformis]|nr:hypothetical protein [Bacteroides uniformis]MBV3480631.1 hypothetical protein [Bacteroides uniformis]MBV3514188.1 hypothetical protein [Bacteroides uniformis]